MKLRIDIQKLVRKNILELKPFSSARGEYNGEAALLLDANENAFGSPLSKNYHRYPDPQQKELKETLSKIKNLLPSNICIGNGSDELVDHIIRIFCNPGKDNMIICPPTFTMYEVCGNIQDIEVRRINLTETFQLNTTAVLNAVDENTKVIFICSPNNPTGNNIAREDIEKILSDFSGIVVVDEAYINYSSQKSFIANLSQNNNLMVIQTLSKAWGLAGLRIGVAYADPELIRLMNKIKAPYNVSSVSQQLAVEALSNISEMNKWIKQIAEQRKSLPVDLKGFSFVEEVYPSEANFLLIKVTNAITLYNYLLTKKIVVRNQSNQPLCENCLRITIGTPTENDELLDALKKFKA